MPENSYSEQMTRLAAAMESIAAGAGKPLAGKTYSIATDDGARIAIIAVIHALGGEVANA